MFLSYQMQGVLFLPPIIITTIPTPSCTPSKLPLTHVNIPPSTLPSMTVPPSTVPPTTGPFTSLRSTTAPPMTVSSTGTLIFVWTLKIQATCWTRRRYCTPHSTAGYMNAELQLKNLIKKKWWLFYTHLENEVLKRLLSKGFLFLHQNRMMWFSSWVWNMMFCLNVLPYFIVQV